MAMKLYPKTVQTQANIKKAKSLILNENANSKIHCVETTNVFWNYSTSTHHPSSVAERDDTNMQGTEKRRACSILIPNKTWKWTRKGRLLLLILPYFLKEDCRQHLL
ncbi:hypothetical protein TNCV_2691011 [Trichonephila clavipes]|uniref:Uncharacterized protein n=1 Tax=Trichonephila clavipes TaxID=2585209 RepID=A0A8X6VYR4_TRICX|nr:hypothetical protein TNCV_2691011 [Trichonephila clavipes]